MVSEEPIDSVVAWHAVEGVNGTRNRGSTKAGATTKLSLLAPSPHVVRILDNHGRPVAGLRFSLNVAMTDDQAGWIAAREIAGTIATSDNNGEVRFNWLPADKIRAIDIEPMERGWKEDQTDQDKISDRITTSYVRRERAVQGRLNLPEGTDAHGILISGFGFGTGNNGHKPATRVRSDGTFTMLVAGGHGYAIGVADLQWSSEIWTGAIVPAEEAAQKEIVLVEGYAATPVEILVTRGSVREPISNALAHISRSAEVTWTDETGKEQSGSFGISSWHLTNEKGELTAGVGRGDVKLRISSGDWTENKAIRVSSNDGVRIHFHRPWIGNRKLQAQPVLDAARYVPSTGAVAIAWTARTPQVDKIHTPSITASGAYIAALVAWCVITPWLHRRFSDLCIILVMLDRYHCLPSSGHVNVKIAPDGITWTSTYSDRFATWASVKRMVIDIDYVYIQINFRTYNWIPRRLFRTDTEWSNFIVQLEDFGQKECGQKPIPLSMNSQADA